MKSLFLLIILTQNGAGDINASFANTKTLQQCQQKASMLVSVFKSSNIPVIVNRCIESRLQFSEFGHISAASKIQNYYLIYIDTETTRISAMPDWRTCIDLKSSLSVAETGQDVKSASFYCGSSAQTLTEDKAD